MRSTQLLFAASKHARFRRSAGRRRVSRGRPVSPMSKDDSEEEDDPLHELGASATTSRRRWCTSSWDTPLGWRIRCLQLAVALSDREKRVLHYLASRGAGGDAPSDDGQGLGEPGDRELDDVELDPSSDPRAKAIDARARARTAPNRLVPPRAPAGTTSWSRARTPRLRCVPSAHDAAIARNGERLRALMRDDQTFAAAVSPAVGLSRAKPAPVDAREAPRRRDCNPRPSSDSRTSPPRPYTAEEDTAVDAAGGDAAGRAMRLPSSLGLSLAMSPLPNAAARRL